MAVNQSKNISLTKLLGNTKKALESAEYLTKDDLKRIGNLVVDQIRTRTQNGVGVDQSGREVDLSTRPYSPKYADYKGVSPLSVDLTLTGDMLENMFVKKADSESIEISVRARDYGKLRGAEEGVKQRQGKGKGRVKLVKRPFFNISKNDVEDIKNNETFQRILDKATQKMLKDLEK